MDFNLNVYSSVLNNNDFSLTGLNSSQVPLLRKKYGENKLKQKKRKSIFNRIFHALSEPMILILLFACIIMVGINLGNLFAGKEVNFFECFGILGAIVLSVGLTVVMENKSEKAFEILKKFSDSIMVTVIRDGKRLLVDYSELVVGDLLLVDTGDKITADGVIVECNELESEESTLTGESIPVKKSVYNKVELLGENMLYSGSYVKNGSAKIIVLAVGVSAQMGKIASGLEEESKTVAPLSQKLTKLSKKITIFGASAAIISFILSIARLYFTNSISFEGIKDAFIQTIALIVAAVPEGLPATVAIALALSVVKLAKSNAVIKKLVAAETVGCVSVICSDKTGTLTVGKMRVEKFVTKDCEYYPSKLKNKWIKENIVHNSTAFFALEKGKVVSFGNSTEQALINAEFADNYRDLACEREKVKIIKRENFNSKRKYMLTSVFNGGRVVSYMKGSIEKILELCDLGEEQKKFYLNKSNFYASNAERILAFAHSDENLNYVFDGFCVINDAIRRDVYTAVDVCKKAGIKVKILTGDNKDTAVAIAKKLGILHTSENILTGKDVETFSDSELKNKLSKITIIARSTPETKLRVVKLLKEMGEVVAVTGDGVNDAPAIKNADIGISMGDGSEITKEASDIILLDNSFTAIVKAVAFGRNIYRNFQRFIFFQLTVNFSAVLVTIAFLLMGFASPFSTLQLLWINIIMDGPLALTLGLEKREEDYMEDSPVKRTDAIVNKKMFLRIITHSLFITMVILLQKQFNFLKVSPLKMQSTIFATFVLFQLFNAFNARELGTRTIIHSLGKNKAFILLLVVTFLMQLVITEFLCAMFDTLPLGAVLWVKIICLTLSVVFLSEGYKCLYKKLRNLKLFKKISKRRKFA